MGPGSGASCAISLNTVLTAEEPGLRLSVKEVHGPVALLHKGGGSTDRTSDYRPVVLLNSLFQLISYIMHPYRLESRLQINLQKN